MFKLNLIAALAAAALLSACSSGGPVAYDHNSGGDGSGDSSTNFTLDTSPTVSTPPADGDGEGNPQPDPAPGGDGSSPNPAADGEEATNDGFEKPEQGGDVDGFQADISPTTDAPTPAGG